MTSIPRAAGSRRPQGNRASTNGKGSSDGPAGMGDEALADALRLLDQLAGQGVSREALLAAIHSDDDTAWPTPRPLPGTAPVPDWPGGLGAVADEFVAAVAANTATPPDLAGMCVLGIASTVVAGSVVVNGGPDWREPTIMQLVPIAASGEGKTPALAAVRAPLDEVEHAWRLAAKAGQAEVEEGKRTAESQLQTAAEEAKAAESGLREAKKLATRKGADPVAVAEQRVADAKLKVVQAKKKVSEHDAAHSSEEQVLPRFYMRDATPEAISVQMANQGGRIAVVTDEASGFFENASHYNAKGSKANWDIYPPPSTDCFLRLLQPTYVGLPVRCR